MGSFTHNELSSALMTECKGFDASLQNLRKLASRVMRLNRTHLLENLKLQEFYTAPEGKEVVNRKI